jgi:hypothetical protein
LQLATIALVAALYNIPRFLEFDVISLNATTSEVLNATTSEVQIALTALLRDPYYQVWYRNVSYIVIMSGVPLLVTSLLTVRILITVTKASNARQEMTECHHNSPSTSTNTSSSMTKLLISLIVVFIICQTPTAVQRIMVALDPQLMPCGSVMFYFQEIALLMVAVNSSTNILLYVTCSADFRSAGRAILCRGIPCREKQYAGYQGVKMTMTEKPRTSLSVMNTTV